VRVVVDSNVLIRALMNPVGTWGDVLTRFSEYTPIMSPPIAEELLRIVGQPRLKKRFGVLGQPQAIDRALQIIALAEVVEPIATPRVCRDPHDDHFFACAVAGNADYIVSEDEDILAIPEYEGVRTIRAAAFLRLLDASR
jgi:putative PIN family toxin of toxin-antitoxin system